MILTDNKEPDVVALNYRHPIARGIDYFVNHGLVERDLVGRRAVTTQSVNTIRKVHTGFGRYQPALSNGAALMLTAAPGTATSDGTYTGDYTLATYLVFHNLGHASNQNIFGMSHPSGGFPDTGLAIAATTNKITMFRNGTATAADTPAIPGVGVPTLIAGTRASGTITAFMNGYPSSTASISTAIGNASARVYYGQYPNSSWLASAASLGIYTFLWSAWWKRALSKRELATLARDPWCLVRVEDRPIGMVPVVVGGLSIPIAAYHYNHHLGTMAG